MTDTFRRRCESVLTLATFLASAWRCGSVAPGAFRAGLVLLTAVLLLILTACPTAHGITRVGTTEQEVAAGALSISQGSHEGYSFFASTDGGLTWQGNRVLMLDLAGHQSGASERGIRAGHQSGASEIGE